MASGNSSRLQANLNVLDFVWRFLSLNKSGWIIAGILFLLLATTIFNPSAPQLVLNKLGFIPAPETNSKAPELTQDPLGIDGIWKYETNLVTLNHPKGYNGIVGYKGDNTITIFSDKYGYSMKGKRTHIMRYGATNWEQVSTQIIEMSGVVADVNRSTFSFHFEISQGRAAGFTELQLNSGKNKMNGNIYYLYPDGKWDIVEITFTRE